MDPTLREELLDASALAKAEALGLHARYVVEGYMSGEHKSPYHGFAIEFAQHREYAHGDDMRHLDWKVLGRTDRYYIKQYEQETNYVANILLDGSESMNYGSGNLTKLQYGKIMSACLSYLILHQRDAVALGIFDDTLRDYAPRSNNLATLPAIMERLAKFEATQETDISEILNHVAMQTRRKGITIIISDCFDDEERIVEGMQHLRFGGHEVILFHTLDHEELDFPFHGLVEFDGLENIPKILTRPAEIRASYLRELEAFNARLRDACLKNNVHYVQVDTSKPLAQVLSEYLNFRARTAKAK